MRQFPTTAPINADALSAALLDQILAKLGIDLQAPSPEALTTFYAAWCTHVPFDNSRKLIHMRSGGGGPMPGSTAEDFFTAWLKHGTGGTCWAGSNALHAVVAALGYDVERGIGTMLVLPHLPPNHGTVLVKLEGGLYLVDSSMLHGVPLLLDEHAPTEIDHPAWGLKCAQRDGFWHVAWRPMHKMDGLECRIDFTGSSGENHRSRYAGTAEWSPFNYELSTRLNRGNQTAGASFGKWLTLHDDGTVTYEALPLAERNRRLVEFIGFSEEWVSQIPDDIPTPPPPGSKTAAELT